MKIIREMTSCSCICGANEKWVIYTFKTSTVLRGRAFNYIFRYKSACKALYCIRILACWFDISTILHESNMGTEACFCLNNF